MYSKKAAEAEKRSGLYYLEKKKEFSLRFEQSGIAEYYV